MKNKTFRLDCLQRLGLFLVLLFVAVWLVLFSSLCFGNEAQTTQDGMELPRQANQSALSKACPKSAAPTASAYQKEKVYIAEVFERICEEDKALAPWTEPTPIP